MTDDRPRSPAQLVTLENRAGPHHRAIIAWGFRIVGAVVGLPASMVFVFCGSFLLLGALAAETDGALDRLDVQHDGIAGLITAGGSLISGILHVFLFFVDWIAVIVAIVALFVALAGAGLFLVGRGLHRRALWSRVSAGVICCLLLLASLSGTTLAEGDGALLTAPPIGISLYGLWVIGWRFA